MITEREIIEGCINNKIKYQHLLFTKYSGLLMTVSLRYAVDNHEAEDILQESFIKIFAAIHQYRFEGSFEGWLKRIVVNCALRSLQKKKIHFLEITNYSEGIAEQINSNFSPDLNEEELLNLIIALPTGYRLVFNLHVIEGYSHEEIARMLDIETVTSRSQLVKAKKLLQKKILMYQKN